MSRTAPVLAATVLLVMTVALCPAQVRTELQPDAVLSSVREMIPVMSRTLGVRVYEPIPIRVVKRSALEKAMTAELAAQLQIIWRDGVSEGAGDALTPETGATTSRSHTVAARTAAELAPRYLVRCVFEKKTGVLYVVPENLESLISADRTPSSQIKSLLRYELVRELTRLADEERRAMRTPRVPPEGTLHAYAARVAFLEGRATWAATRLVPGLVRPLLPIQVKSAELRDQARPDRLLAYAFAGTGCERGRTWAGQLATGGGAATMKAMVLDAPTAFSSFPPSAADASERAARPGPLDAVVGMAPMLCAGDGWQTEAKKPDASEIAGRLERGGAPSQRTRSLMRGMNAIREATGNRVGGGSIHVSAVHLKNPSAAYAWMRAEEKRLADRVRSMTTDGFAILSNRKRTRDLSGYPVLMMTETVIESEEKTIRIARLYAVRGNYFVAVSAMDVTLGWDRVRAFLEKIRPLLTSGVRYPG